MFAGGIKGAVGFDSRCSVYLLDSQLMTSGETEKILWDTAFYDNDSNFDLVTNHRFVAKVAGVYHVSAQLTFGGMMPEKICKTLLYKNDVNVRLNKVNFYLANSIYVPVSGDIELVVDDYLEVWGFHDAGIQRSISSYIMDTYFNIHQIA
ncbi:hypothetical protein ES705_14355 [subsurface metagenome]